MRFRTFLLAFLLLDVAATPALRASDKKQTAAISDDELFDKVKRKLADDALVKGGALDVEIHSGVVTLKGKVADDKAKSRAEKLVKKVHGVSKVDNQLVVSQDANPQD
jgi:osmotically-inducible protein OsmY